MKAIITLFGILLLMNESNAQGGAGVVTDPTTHLHLIDNIKVATESATALKKQINILEEAKKAVTTVSSAIRTGQIIDNIIKCQKDVYTRSRKSYEELEKSKMFGPGELSVMMNSFTMVVANSETTLRLVNNILKDDLFKMSDAERLKTLQDAETKLSAFKNDVIVLQYKYDRIRQMKMVNKVFYGS